MLARCVLIEAAGQHLVLVTVDYPLVITISWLHAATGTIMVRWQLSLPFRWLTYCTMLPSCTAQNRDTLLLGQGRDGTVPHSALYRPEIHTCILYSTPMVEPRFRAWPLTRWLAQSLLPAWKRDRKKKCTAGVCRLGRCQGAHFGRGEGCQK